MYDLIHYDQIIPGLSITQICNSPYQKKKLYVDWQNIYLISWLIFANIEIYKNRKHKLVKELYTLYTLYMWIFLPPPPSLSPQKFTRQES